MSWNFNLRLNNLQQQINNIVDKGLINPLESNLDANNFQILNLSILDGGDNQLQINTNNSSGITMNNKLTVSNDISCNKLTYQSLSPIPSANLEEVLQTGNNANGEFINELGGLKFLNEGAYINLANVNVQQLSNLTVENQVEISNISGNSELILYNGNNEFKLTNQFNGNFTISDIDYTFLTIVKGDDQVFVNSLANSRVLQIGATGISDPQIRFNYGDGTNNGDKYILVCYNNLYQIQQFQGTTDVNRPFTINGINSITLKTKELIYDDTEGHTGTILTTLDVKNQISQIYNGVNATYQTSQVVSNILSIPITSENINYVSLIFNNLTITCTNQNLNPNTTATLYLSNQNIAGYNSTISFNTISYTLNQNNGVFTSSIPIEMILVENNISTVYLIILFNSVSITPYQVNFNANILLKGSPSLITNNSININPSG
jgi:hypothetical protein